MTLLRQAKCWIITRTDGQVYYYTNHNSTIFFLDIEFKPIVFKSSAVEKQALETGNVSVMSAFEDDTITFEDLRGGRFTNATVVEYLVDWKFPFVALDTQEYIIAGFNFDGDIWNGKLVSAKEKLNASKARTFAYPCQWDLFGKGCGLIEEQFTVEGIVTDVNEDRNTFSTDVLRPDEYFQYGKLTWLTGLNVGTQVSHIKEYTNSQGRFSLQINTPFNIQIADAFKVSAGCDKLKCTCKFKFDNELNYGGFPFMPGNDKVLQTPDGKA